jgi:hypothetical protein
MTVASTANASNIELPVRAGVFARIADVERAIDALESAGFSKHEIVVVCSSRASQEHFGQYAQQQPAGQNTPAAAAAGSTLGAALGGVSMLALGAATGGLPLAIVGGAGLLTGGVVGGFLSAMLMRGVEKEAADYYDQAVQQGKLLVAVEPRDPNDPGRLAKAEQILAQAGAEPLPLPAG